MTLPFEWHPLGWWKAQVNSLVMPPSGLHMILQCKDTKLWPVSGCIHANLSASLYPEGQSQQKEMGTCGLDTQVQV
jgi:hypothetical protein